MKSEDVKTGARLLWRLSQRQPLEVVTVVDADPRWTKQGDTSHPGRSSKPTGRVLVEARWGLMTVALSQLYPLSEEKRLEAAQEAWQLRNRIDANLRPVEAVWDAVARNDAAAASQLVKEHEAKVRTWVDRLAEIEAIAKTATP